jgi:hypothetical protein
MSETQFTSGMLVFPNLTQLDLTGPYEVLARLPGEPRRSYCGRTLNRYGRSTG